MKGISRNTTHCTDDRSIVAVAYFADGICLMFKSKRMAANKSLQRTGRSAAALTRQFWVASR
jgi:hypothetical protein